MSARSTIGHFLINVGTKLVKGDKHTYTVEQRRVCDYLIKITHGMVGCGDDPVGFLIASHAALRRQLGLNEYLH